MENTILDQELNPSSNLLPLQIADRTRRFANYIVDLIAFYFALIAGVILVESSFPGTIGLEGRTPFLENVFFLVFYVLYYTLVEGTFGGKTLGKLFTKTRAVTEYGEPIGYGKAFARSLWRIFPFEQLSFLSKPVGWHDSRTRTLVVRD